MEDLIKEIRAAIDGGAWVLALFGTLALPDICAALASEDGRTTGRRYKEWFGENLGEKYPKLDADECYQMRCSMLHQGATKTASYGRVIFAAPGPGRIHNCVADDALILDLPTFCNDVIDAAEKWLQVHMLDSNVVRNSVSLVQWHQGGLPGYVGGMTVLS